MSGLPSSGAIIDDLPLLTEVLDGKPLPELPILTEIIPEPEPPAETEIAEAPDERCISEEALLALLQQKIEAHLETVFAQKLAQLHRQAAEQALTELKATLPELLRDVLNTTEKTCRMG